MKTERRWGEGLSWFCLFVFMSFLLKSAGSYVEMKLSLLSHSLTLYDAYLKNAFMTFALLESSPSCKEGQSYGT